MYRKLMGILALVLLLAGAALAEESYPQPYTGDLTGTWGFAGGAEEQGDGFRLNPDGTGVWLEIVDYDQVPPQFRDTVSSFTWEVSYAEGKTLLHQTGSDGRTFTCEVETYGNVQIHIPNESSGGFYFPVLNDDAAAYLADKAELSAFDGVLQDYLDGSITGKIEAMGLTVYEICLQQEEGAWRIVLSGRDNASGQQLRLILDEQYIDVCAETTWLWGDFDLGQRWFAPADTAGYYTGLPGILQSYLAWEYAEPQPTPEPEVSEIPELTARLGSFPANKTYKVYEVYIGEGEDNLQAGNGKAKVSTNGDIWVYALWRGKLLVEYEISDGRCRIGWIVADQLPESALQGVPELPDSRDPEENRYGVVTEDSWLTDDPHYNGLDPNLTDIPEGTSVRVLARLESYLLVQCFIDRQLRMGFVPESAVVLDEGYAQSVVYIIDQAASYTEADIRSAMNAAAAFIESEFAGDSLMEIRYVEAESADPLAWWQDPTGQLEGMLLYADLNSMSMWDGEIAGNGVARDYQFILYREPGGQWYVGNHGYT